MIRAVLFLQFSSLKNTLRQRFQRLKQPRYLFGALAGAAYFYFFMLRHFFKPHRIPQGLPSLPTELPVLLEPIAAFVLFGVVTLSWILPSGRASLAFTEAEVAFLFPAPVPRRSLINYKLLKSQFAILFTSLIISLLSRRWDFLGGSVLTHAIGWWLIFSIANLHSIGASFTCERLLDSGVNPLRRRLIASALLIGAAAVGAVWMRRHLPNLEDSDLTGLTSILQYFDRVLDAPGLRWLLLPLRLVVRPFLAPTLAAFVQSLWPVLLIAIGHYLWILQAEVAFEEHSVAVAQKRAERVAAFRSGDWRSRRASANARREPFPLRPRGTPTIAFLWNNLIALGPRYYVKTWVITAFVLVAIELWLVSNPIYQPFVQMAGLFSAIIGVYALLLGPLIVRRGSHRIVQRLEQMKAYPLRGSQVILGELLSPMVLLSAAEFILLAILAIAASNGAMHFQTTPAIAFTTAAAVALILPPTIGLMFGLNFIGILYFPAWTPTGNQPPGIERMGQGLIFFAAYLIVLIVCLAPAGAIGGVSFALAHIAAGSFPLDIAITAIVSLAVLCGELYAFVWWLGQRYENFDLSAELPR